MILVDANLLLYAEDSRSEEHAEAREWWDAQLSGTEPVGLSWQVITAFVVLRAGVEGDEACRKGLQDHVKAVIAPFKYPRAVNFVAALPKTQTGKIQRFRLREQ